jgi:hypothetical protein
VTGEIGQPDAVAVAYIHGNEISYSWHHSLIELLAYDLAHHGRVLRGGWVGMRPATGGIVEGRNKTIQTFLQDREAQWLWWVDTDMGFAPDTVERLMDAADPVERPVVGALCFAYAETSPDGMGGSRCSPRPTIFDWVGDGEQAGFRGWTNYPVSALVRCAGTGAACILIHRSVLERIQERYGPTWYDRAQAPSGKGWISEDLSFCLRLGALEIPLWVHTGVRTTHAKRTWVAEDDYWSWAAAPPATEEVAVLVPVLGRPEHAEPFMSSLRASTGLARCYAICDPEDSDAMAAWDRAGAIVLLDPAMRDRPGSFAEKVNFGYGKTGEPWVLLVGSDVCFHPGWLDHAQAMAGDRYHVIGTNDLGNPRVLAGEHAVHPLVRRSYIDQVGASWDGPGVVCHEGYRHWFVDDEIVGAAKQRGVWAMALASKVEHLHPLWGKGNPDEVYQLGEQHAAADRQHFVERLDVHAPQMASR